MITNSQTGTRIDEIEEGIYRISTPVDILPGGFTFNQFLVVDEAPLLFHTGLRRMFPLVREAIEKVVPVSRLRYLGISHFEADESGAVNEFLAVAPEAVPVCSQIGTYSVNDVADRPARAMAGGEELGLGKRSLKWLDVPHLPHGWDCGYFLDTTSRTLLCGDLFTQGGAEHEPVTESDILGPSEEMRAQLDYYAHAAQTRTLFERLAAERPRLLACMHGSSWRGDGAALLLELAEHVEGRVVAVK